MKDGRTWYSWQQENWSREDKRISREERAGSKAECVEVSSENCPENGIIIVPNEVQSGYFGGRVNFSLHTGYQYSKENSGGFVSLSDENNHKAEAINCALEPKMRNLAESGKKERQVDLSDKPMGTGLWHQDHLDLYRGRAWQIR